MANYLDVKNFDSGSYASYKKPNEEISRIKKL